MTDQAAYALIRESVPYKAGGNIESAWQRYRASNPGEATRLLAYLDARIRGQSVIAPVMGTKFGRGFLDLIDPVVPVPVPPPVPVPVPPSVFKRKKGALVVNASACSPDLLRQAGITHVAVELTAENMFDAAFRRPGQRWDGFTIGGLFISRGGDTENEVNHAATITTDQLLDFLVIDTESHKTDMGGNLAWTETLYAALRSKLGPAFPLYNITFGIHQDPTVVNHDTFRKHNITPIWETYDGVGATLGVARTVAKANAEGWTPAHVCLGDKSLAVEVAEAKVLSGLGDVWAWAPEQSGADILELAKVPV